MTPKQIELAFKAKLITDIEQLEEGINIVYTCNSVTIGEFASLVIADACKEKDERIAELEEALELAKSVCNSVNKSSRHEVKVDGERYFIQTEEWVSWASHEVLDKIIDALKNKG